MSTTLRAATRLAAISALLFAGFATFGTGLASAAPGNSNHCTAGLQVRFNVGDVPGTKSGISVSGSGKVWTWTYEHDASDIIEIWVFGGNNLKSADSSGTLDATALDLRNNGNQIADISHVDFCLDPGDPDDCEEDPQAEGCEQEGDDCEEDPQAEGCEQSEDDCEEDPQAEGCEQSEDDCVEGDEREECQEDEDSTTVTPGGRSTDPDAGFDDIDTEVEGIVVEAPVQTPQPQPEAEAVDSTPAALPRTGVSSLATALAAFAAMGTGTGMVAVSRRRHLR